MAGAVSSDERQARVLISSGTPWEESVGYSRAVRVGHTVYVSGTVASDESGEVIAPGDPGGQTEYILAKITRALEEAGADISTVVRTRMYVTDMGFAEAVGSAHRAVFESIRPASTMVEVSRLAHPDHLVEIEVDAVLDHGMRGPG